MDREKIIAGGIVVAILLVSIWLAFMTPGVVR